MLVEDCLGGEKVRKKAIVVSMLILLMLAVPFVAVAQAGMGQTKQSFELDLKGKSVRTADTKYWLDGTIYQARGYSFVASYIELKVGGVVVDVVSYAVHIDMMLDLATKQGVIRLWETLTLADGSTVELKIDESLYHYGTTDYYAVGSFVGKGTGDLDGILIVGKSGADMVPDLSSPTGESALISRIGTVMGWPE